MDSSDAKTDCFVLSTGMVGDYDIQFTVGPSMSQYQRNNKADQTKRLRCFPQCSVAGHMNQGFCGRAIEAVLSTKLYVPYAHHHR